MAEGYFQIAERQRFVDGGHVVFAFDDVQQIEHFGVEHFPRADLLLHHIEAGALLVAAVLD